MSGLRKLLIQEIEDFLDESGMTASNLGREAVGDNKFVTRVHRGAGITLNTIERLESYISGYRSRVQPGSQIDQTRSSQPPEIAA
jgi:hypothetical protein